MNMWQVALIYPSDEAVQMESLVTASSDVRKLVFIDSTWLQAKKIFSDSRLQGNWRLNLWTLMDEKEVRTSLSKSCFLQTHPAGKQRFIQPWKCIFWRSEKSDGPANNRINILMTRFSASFHWTSEFDGKNPRGVRRIGGPWRHCVAHLLFFVWICRWFYFPLGWPAWRFSYFHSFIVCISFGRCSGRIRSFEGPSMGRLCGPNCWCSAWSDRNALKRFWTQRLDH